MILWLLKQDIYWNFQKQNIVHIPNFLLLFHIPKSSLILYRNPFCFGGYVRSWAKATGPRSHGQRCCRSYICGKGNLIGTLFYYLVLKFTCSKFIGSPEPKASRLAYRIPWIRRPSVRRRSSSSVRSHF